VKSAHGESVIEHITRQWQQERPDLDLGDFLLAIYLRRLGQLIENEYDRMCQARFGMSARDMRVLLALRRGGPPHALRPTDLFEALLVTSGAVTKQVDRLERRRLVKRLPDPDHGGGFRVQLTPRGLEMVDTAVDLLARSSPIRPATSRLNKGECDRAARFCLDLISMLDEVKKPASAASTAPKKARRTPRPRA
jgi:DNA-binding MarR family transcriptional regulator